MKRRNRTGTGTGNRPPLSDPVAAKTSGLSAKKRHRQRLDFHGRAARLETLFGSAGNCCSAGARRWGGSLGFNDSFSKLVRWKSSYKTGSPRPVDPLRFRPQRGGGVCERQVPAPRKHCRHPLSCISDRNGCHASGGESQPAVVLRR